MIEVCKVCRRNRPTYIADPTCPKGGYCEWVETVAAIPVRGNAPGHIAECKYRRACDCAIPIACTHGYDVCPQCDPCTCNPKRDDVSSPDAPSR